MSLSVQLYYECGLKALSGISSDMRILEGSSDDTRLFIAHRLHGLSHRASTHGHACCRFGRD